MDENNQRCIWKTSKDIVDPGLVGCVKCECTREHAIGSKCETCIFVNPDGNYSGNYMSLINKMVPVEVA